MTTWLRSAEPFCRFARRRRESRRRMLIDAYRRARNETSRKLADRLAAHWHFDPNTVMTATLADARAGDAEALEWLRVCAPDLLQHEPDYPGGEHHGKATLFRAG